MQGFFFFFGGWLFFLEILPKHCYGLEMIFLKAQGLIPDCSFVCDLIQYITVFAGTDQNDLNYAKLCPSVFNGPLVSQLQVCRLCLLY